MNRSIFRPLAGCLFLILAAVSPSRAGSAFISKVSGLAQTRRAGTADWDNVAAVPREIEVGDAVRTGARAAATLTFTDGSRVELGPNASLTLRDADARKSSVFLRFGWINAFVKHLPSRRFEVLTPTALCADRGAPQFRVDVDNGGRTTVDLYRGLLAVADHRGQQVLLHPNERLWVDLRGLGRTGLMPTRAQIERVSFHLEMQREMLLDMNRAQVLADSAREARLGELQQGKVLTDAFGSLVRVEEYVLRPAPNQFELVVLNGSKAGFDYFTYLGTFNASLPGDIRIALDQLGGTVGAMPTYWLTGYQTVRSNMVDSVVEIANGGHPVDVNGSVDPTEAVSTFFNPVTNQFVNVAGQPVYQTLFNNYGFYVDGALKFGWTGTNIQTYNTGYGAASPTMATTNDPITGALLASPVGNPSTSATIPNPSQSHQEVYQSFYDGTFLQWDNYVVNGQGQVATPATFGGATSGIGYEQGILGGNYEQVITASEFGGRSIDILFAPKILVQSPNPLPLAGLIQ